MIVIMRDAVMPECCNACVCSEGYGCGITGTEMTTKEMGSRPDWCPLEEVEPCEDAVSRQAAIDGADAVIARDTSGNNDVVKAMTAWKSYVEVLPSAQPEIIRCKDCVYYHPNYCEIWSKYGTVQTRENGFCYMAQRREEGYT